MLRVHNIKVPLTYREEDLPKAAAKVLKLSPSAVTTVKLARKSIDARKKPDICFVLSLDVTLSSSEMERRIARSLPENQVSLLTIPETSSPRLSAPPAFRPVVVGMGPAGLFAALALAEAGANPILLERGRPAAQRQLDVERYWKEGASGFSPVSNVQFGEGGAGTFSDGKLNSGIKDPQVMNVLKTFVRFGAPPEILYDAKPHIGTDRLVHVVTAMREAILAAGGEVRFETRMTRLLHRSGKLVGLVYEGPEGENEIPCRQVILALGHSSRDTMTQLQKDGFTLVPKPFSMGVRIEHPQRIINEAQWGIPEHPLLGAADYKLAVHLPSGRGVYTFCMCPGGTVVAAASEKDTVVTNGMSRYARDSGIANSALLVGIEPDDFPGKDPLAGMYWQRELEQKAFLLGGSRGHAPCQRVGDLLGTSGHPSVFQLDPTYLPGVSPASFTDLYPAFLTDALREALPLLARKLRHFDDPHALLTGPETRSSSPVRMPRNDTLESTDVSGVYPCGEGAGYAGGITSAAVDGLRCADACLHQIGGLS